MSFLPGLELCRRFYAEIVRPLIEQHFPDLPYAAARIGPGSDVLGFDTEMSMDTALSEAYVLLTQMHNALGLTDPLSATISQFFNRPFQVIDAGVFIEPLLELIKDPEVLRVAKRRLIGNIDQWSDNSDLREEASWRPLLRTLYQ